MIINVIRVLIADDHAIVREGLKLILETADDIAVVGMAADGHEALAQAKALMPDVLLLDLRMPVVDGLAVLQTLSKTHPEIRVVILTTYNEPELMVEALQAGALGYLLKDTAREMLFKTIRAAAEGKSLLQPEILTRVMTALQDQRAEKTSADPLTARELEVLHAVAEGARNKEIAAALGITERTVKAHLTHIFNKLGVDSRASAVATALREGFLDLDDGGLCDL